MEAKFKSDGIIPDVIKDGHTLAEELTVKYGDHAVKMGELLTKNQTSRAPSVAWKGDPSTKYTLIMSDPDAPSRETHEFRSWLHWIVANIPENNLSKGDTLTKYGGPSPPRGKHRYVLLLYRQKEDVRDTPSGLPHFNTDDYATKNKLEGPIAGQYYYVQK